jgi:putative aminopeptidase FrvX
MNKSEISLLKTLSGIFAPSANEILMKEFLLTYIEKNKKNWLITPEIIIGKDFQDCILLKFGTPRTAIFAHMDSIGFTVRYENQLVPIGGPDVESGYKLVGKDSFGEIECTLEVDDDHRIYYKFGRAIDRGTELVFKQNFIESSESIQTCYLDNRLGIYNALKVAEDLCDGLIVFSCREEHGGGTVSFLAKFMYEQLGVRQALISDITWITDGILPGEGVVVSMRDRGLPRRQYLDKIILLAENSGIPYQLEVEGSGGSDAKELQESPYPIDWCFIGAAEENAHSPNETVVKSDISAMINLYKVLMKEL